MSTTYVIVAQGTGAFPPGLLTVLQAWPRGERDARAIFDSIGRLDPRITTRALLVTHKDPRNMIVEGARRPRWDLWMALPQDFPPDPPEERPCRGPAP